MKRKVLIRYVVLCMIVAFSLFGCAKESTELKDSLETSKVTQVQPSGNTSEDRSSPIHQVDHVKRNIKENHYIDAGVYMPAQTTCSTYRVELLDSDPIDIAKKLFPNEGPYTVTNKDYATNVLTSDGKTICITPSRIYSGAAIDEDGKKWEEIEILLNSFTQQEAKVSSKSLDFLSYDEAIKLGKETIKNLGVCLDPVLQVCVGMDAAELISFQKELLKVDEESQYESYNPFGKAYIFSDLSSDYDAYYLKFGFRYDGIPLYGYEGEPLVMTQTSEASPSAMYADMVISSNGIERINIFGTYSSMEKSITEPILTFEQVIAKYEEQYEETLLPTEPETWIISSIYMEYLPVWEDELYLIPYWCFLGDVEYSSPQTGEQLHIAAAFGDRLNAFSGENFEYGG